MADAGDMSDENVEELKQVFKLFDRNGDDTMNPNNLKDALRALGQNPSQETVRNLISQYDAQGTGTIDITEFLSLIANRDKKFLNDEEELRDAFNIFDKDQDGYLARHEFESAMRNLGDGLNEEELEKMLKYAPYDKAGKLSYEKFVAYIYNVDGDK